MSHNIGDAYKHWNANKNIRSSNIKFKYLITKTLNKERRFCLKN